MKIIIWLEAKNFLLYESDIITFDKTKNKEKCKILVLKLGQNLFFLFRNKKIIKHEIFYRNKNNFSKRKYN